MIDDIGEDQNNKDDCELNVDNIINNQINLLENTLE